MTISNAMGSPVTTQPQLSQRSSSSPRHCHGVKPGVCGFALATELICSGGGAIVGSAASSFSGSVGPLIGMGIGAGLGGVTVACVDCCISLWDRDITVYTELASFVDG